MVCATSPPLATPLALALAGPTASGKTSIALAMAAQGLGHEGVEIISVDSALVYRGMDIGSAKPSPAERAAVAHHLIDIRDPLNAYSAAEFARDAQALVQDIRARGKFPLLVGGSMLYFKALMEGLSDMPAADPAVRLAIQEEAAQKGWPALHADLRRVDPVTAARLAPADSQRIARALEVFRLTGKPLSALHSPTKNSLESQLNWQNVPLLSLEPQERSWLHARIETRFSAMLDHGFLDEVKTLRARGDLHPDLPSMRCVGYRQAWQALDGLIPLHELRERGIFATRQLAKRQLTWLRSLPHRQVLQADAPDALPQALQWAQALLKF